MNIPAEDAQPRTGDDVTINRPINPDTIWHAALTAIDRAVEAHDAPVRVRHAFEFDESSYTRGSIRQAFSGLLRVGLIERQVEPEGRAIYKYTLTPLGEQLLEEYGPYEE